MSPEMQNAFRHHIRAMATARAVNRSAYWQTLQRDLDLREGGAAMRALSAA